MFNLTSPVITRFICPDDVDIDPETVYYSFVPDWSIQHIPGSSSVERGQVYEISIQWIFQLLRKDEPPFVEFMTQQNCVLLYLNTTDLPAKFQNMLLASFHWVSLEFDRVKHDSILRNTDLPVPVIDQEKLKLVTEVITQSMSAGN